jgi:hypothetical protein
MMNTFDSIDEKVEEQVEPVTKSLPDEKLPALVPPREDDSLPVLIRPAKRPPETFLPEWLRRLSHG